MAKLVLGQLKHWWGHQRTSEPAVLQKGRSRGNGIHPSQVTHSNGCESVKLINTDRAYARLEDSGVVAQSVTEDFIDGSLEELLLYKIISVKEMKDRLAITRTAFESTRFLSRSNRAASNVGCA